MSVIDVIRRRSVTLPVERRNMDAVVDGFQTEAAPTEFNIQGHIQQATSKEMRNAPEGQRAQDWRVLWTETQMFVADRITQGSVEYIVQSVEDWSTLGGFYKAMMTEVEDLIP